MIEEMKEKIKREAWFIFFTEYLYKHEFISEEQKREIEKQI